MVYASETKNYVGDVGVFLGEEAHFTIPKSEGVLILREYASYSYRDDDFSEPMSHNCRAYLFDLQYLHSPHSLWSSLARHIRSKLVYVPYTARDDVTEAILKRLVSKFQFKSMPASLHSRKTKIIMAIDVDVEHIFDPPEDYSFAYESEESDSLEDEDAEVEKQEMEEYHEEEADQDVDMDHDLVVSNVQQVHDYEQKSRDVEDLTDDADNNVRDMGESENEDMSEKENEELLKLYTLLSDYLHRPIAHHKLKEVFEKVKSGVKTNTLKMDADLTDTCSICLERFFMGADVATMPCSHRFHTNCIFEWLPNNQLCPLCRSLCATVVHI